MYLDYKLYKAVAKSINDSYKLAQANKFNQSTKLWNEIFFHRGSLYNISDLLIILNYRFIFCKGVAEYILDTDNELFLKYYRHLVTKELVQSRPLSSIGSPSIVEYEDLPVSSHYMSNLRLFSEVSKYVNKYKLAGKRSLNILEIGSGYGGLAYFLILSGIAASYTIVDLSNNLELSSFYLMQNFPNMTWNVPTSTTTDFKLADNELNFLVLGNIQTISDCKFDLVVNSDSLGEMPAATAQAYISLISEHMTDTEHFFSKNGHGVVDDCIQLLSKYAYDKFEILKLSTPTAVSAFFDYFSHYMFLYKSDVSDSSWNHYGQTTLKSLKEKLKILSENTIEGLCSDCINFLKDITYYVLGDKKTSIKFSSLYQKFAKSHIANTYALMAIADSNPKILNSRFQCGDKTDYVLQEVRRYHRYSPLLRYLALDLGKDLLRRKINYPVNYSPSLLLRLKNLVFNIQERKGLSLDWVAWC